MKDDAKTVAAGLSEADICWLSISLASAHVETFGGDFTRHFLGYEGAVTDINERSPARTRKDGHMTPEQEREAVVAWLRKRARECDCAARSEGECACWGYDADPSFDVPSHKDGNYDQIANAIERGEHLKGEQ